MNEYFKEYKNVDDGVCYPSSKRISLVKKWSWAIPNKEAIDYITDQSPVVEIGAGKGYWAKLIRKNGGDIVAYDPRSTYDNRYTDKKRSHTEIRLGDYHEVKNHPDRTLFICWPCHGRDWAFETLKLYLESGGKKLVYVGEGGGGCNATDEFFHLIRSEFGDAKKRIRIPQWSGIHDMLCGYEKL